MEGLVGVVLVVLVLAGFSVFLFRYKSPKLREFSPSFKARVAREALRGDKTFQEIAARYKIHPTQVGAWRDQAKAHGFAVFKPPKSSISVETKIVLVLWAALFLLLIWMFWPSGRVPG